MWGEFWQREGTAHCRESSGAGFMGKGGSKPGPTGQTGSQQASQEGRGRGAGQAKRQGFWKPLQRGEAQEAGAFTGAPPPLTGAPASPNSTDTLCLAQLPLYPGMPPTQITYDRSHHPTAAQLMPTTAYLHTTCYIRKINPSYLIHCY